MFKQCSVDSMYLVSDVGEVYSKLRNNKAKCNKGE
jgi:hypothetical protein